MKTAASRASVSETAPLQCFGDWRFGQIGSSPFQAARTFEATLRLVRMG